MTGEGLEDVRQALQELLASASPPVEHPYFTFPWTARSP